jgi:hypothetical protein
MSAALPTKSARLRAELAWLKSRYDGGAVPSSAFWAIKDLEESIAWSEHRSKYETMVAA